MHLKGNSFFKGTVFFLVLLVDHVLLCSTTVSHWEGEKVVAGHVDAVAGDSFCCFRFCLLVLSVVMIMLIGWLFLQGDSFGEPVAPP